MLQYRDDIPDKKYRLISLFGETTILAKEENYRAIMATPFFFYLGFCSLFLLALTFSESLFLGFGGFVFVVMAIFAAVAASFLSYATFSFYARRAQELDGLPNTVSAPIRVPMFWFEVFAFVMIPLGGAVDWLIR